VNKLTISLPDGSGTVEVEAEDEQSTGDRDRHARGLRDEAERALETNKVFLTIPKPTPAQTADQVQALTRECSAVIRLLLGRLESME